MLKLGCQGHVCLSHPDKQWLTLGILSSTLLMSSWLYQSTAQAATESVSVVHVQADKVVATDDESTSITAASSMATVASSATTSTAASQVPVSAVTSQASTVTSTVSVANAVTSANRTMQSTEASSALSAPVADTKPLNQPATTKAVVSAAAGPKNVGPTKQVAKTTETLDTWMPNKTLQKLALINLAVTFPDEDWHQVSDVTQQQLGRLQDFSSQNWVYIDGNKWKVNVVTDDHHAFSLTGLEFATNLKTLDLSANMNFNPGSASGDIVDITPLHALTKLEELRLDSNRINDITPLVGLTRLQHLSLQYNQITDFSALDPRRYRDLNYSNQVIMNPMAYVPMGHTYTITNPVKAPQGVQLAYGQPWTHDTSSEVVGFDADGNPIEVTYVAAASDHELHGNQITYHNIENQMPISASAEHPGKYYLVSVFYDPQAGNDAPDTVTIYTPYLNLGAPIAIHYVDQTGKALAEAEQMVGVLNTSALVQGKVFAGYQLQQPQQIELNYTTMAQTVTFHYQALPAAVTIHYQDTQGHQLRPDEQLTGLVGQALNWHRPTISHYTYDHQQGELMSTFLATPQVLTVIYHANQTTMTLKYLDDETGNVLQQVPLSGQPGALSDYELASQIQHYVNQGYQAIKDYSQQPLQFEWQSQTYQIHFTHQRVATIKHHQVKRVIYYRFSDGTVAALTKKQQLMFQCTGQKDLVTHLVTWEVWTAPSTVFPAQLSPVITGYQADQPQVNAMTDLTVASPDLEITVTYRRLPAKSVQIIYRDQTTGQQLQTVLLTGKFGERSPYQPTTQLQHYLQAGYYVISSDYPVDGAYFDARAQTYLIQLGHTLTRVTATNLVTQTIQYRYPTGAIARPTEKTTLVFKRVGQHDLVTGQTQWQAWDADVTSFPARVIHPITGFTAQPAVIMAVEQVTATTADQLIVVNYVPIPSTSLQPDAPTSQPSGPIPPLKQPNGAGKPPLIGQVELPASQADDLVNVTQSSVQPPVIERLKSPVVAIPVKSPVIQLPSRTKPQRQLPQTNAHQSLGAQLGWWLLTLLTYWGYRRRH